MSQPPRDRRAIATSAPRQPTKSALPRCEGSRRTPLWAALLVTFAFVLAAGGALAQPNMVDVAGQGSPAPLKFMIGVPSWEAEIRLSNGAGEPRRFRVGTALRRASDGLSVPVAVQRLDGGAADRVIASKGEAVLRLSGHLPTPGVFATSLEVLAVDATGGQEIERIERQVAIEVTREMEPVPAEFLVTPKPEALVWPWFWAAPRVSVLSLRNTGTKPVEFDRPMLFGLTHEEGPDRSSSLAVAQLPTLTSEGCVSPLRPGQSCEMRLTIAEQLLPGVYGIEVGLGGPGGGWSAKTLRISVRASLVLAFMTALAGVWAGVLVDEWRTRGRPLLEGLEQVTRLRDRMSGPVPTDLFLAAADLRARIDEVGSAYERRAGQPGDVDRLKKIVDRFVTARQLSGAFAGLSPAGRSAIAPRYNAVRAELVRTELTEAELGKANAAAQVVAGDIAGWPAAEYAGKTALRLADALVLLAGKVQPPLSGAADPSPVVSALRTRAAVGQPELAFDLADASLRDTIEQRRASLDAAVGRAVDVAQEAARHLAASCVPAAGDLQAEIKTAIGARAQVWRVDAGDDAAARFGDLSALWDAFSAVARPGVVEAPAPAAAPAAPAAPPVPAVSEIMVSFGVHYGQSLAELQAARARHQLQSNWIIAGLAALASAGAVSGNAAWGSPGDIVTVFLAGVGTRIVAGALGSRTTG